MRLLKPALYLSLAGLIGWGAWWAFAPRPVPVDLAQVDRGDLTVTLDEDGLARIRQIYEVSAPVAGRLHRPPVELGDTVRRGVTVVAVLEPQGPAFLDARSRAEAEAARAAARAALRLAEAELERAMAEEAYWAAEVTRFEELARRNAVADRVVAQTRLEHALRRAAISTAMAGVEVRRQELTRAEAVLTGPETPAVAPAPGACCLRLTAPADGKVLALAVESEQVVTAGAPLLTLGDPADLEITVDLLSSEAVRVAPGAPARIERWGGEPPLAARVRRVEAAAFTKISALGIEEQRVRVTLDLLDPPEARPGLGHDYRVFVRITAEARDDVPLVPMGALFRHQGGWAAFRVEDGTARLRPVAVGARTARMAEVRDGLAPGDAVILHPSDRIAEGARVIARDAL